MAFPRVALPSRLASVTRRNLFSRHIHSSPVRAAVAHPITAQGPPPKAPTPEAFKESAAQSAGSAESQPSRPNVSLKKRFWKDVHVHGMSGMLAMAIVIDD